MGRTALIEAVGCIIDGDQEAKTEILVDSGLPNTRGAGTPLATQQDRADGLATYIGDLASLPGAIGYHWFEFRDQPPGAVAEMAKTAILAW